LVSSLESVTTAYGALALLNLEALFARQVFLFTHGFVFLSEWILDAKVKNLLSWMVLACSNNSLNVALWRISSLFAMVLATAIVSNGNRRVAEEADRKWVQAVIRNFITFLKMIWTETTEIA
jgi:hypothetical protein